jgi:hypothetical protein
MMTTMDSVGNGAFDVVGVAVGVGVVCGLVDWELVWASIITLNVDILLASCAVQSDGIALKNV